MATKPFCHWKSSSAIFLLLFFILDPNCFHSSLQGSTFCQAAGAGTVYNATTGLTEPCKAGTYYNDTGCLDCPAGFSCIGYTASPQACPAGTYQQNTGRSSCIPCPSGQSCLDVTTSPVDCVAGQFSTTGQQLCLTCPPGYYSGSKASTCIACGAGKQCSDGITEVDCLAGQFSIGGSSSCTDCQAGEHTDGAPGSSSCKLCPAGFECPTPSNASIPCSAGSYSSTGQTSCSTCPPGMYCDDAASTPKACPPGSYSTGSAGASCTQCPAGQSCVDPSLSPVNCEPGTYSLSGESTCTPCPAGKSCAVTSSSPLTCSTSGEYSLEGNGTCYACPVGFKCPTNGLPPIQCPSGTTTNGNTGAIACEPCPDGSTCADPTTGPTSCPEGSYVPASSTSCASCPAGVYCTGSLAIACDPGSYSPEGSMNCTDCPAGSFCPFTDEALIIACDDGSYSTGAASSCTVCPAGSECPDTDAATINACNSGYYSFGGKSSCTQCAAGQACPDTDGSANFYCVPGTYSLAGMTVCSDCPAGKECPYTTSKVEVNCKTGYYSVGKQMACTMCPAGYACPDNSSPGTICDPGSFSIGGQVSCIDCGAGFACPSIYLPYVITCPPGSYAEAKKTFCTVCPAGEFCANTLNIPSTCADGFYSTGGETECHECPAGFVCVDKTQNPVGCTAGTYSNARQNTACQPCNAGYACPEKSTSANPDIAICPLGSYCTSGIAVPVLCSAGTYGAVEGLKASSECSKCPAGYFCEEGTAGHPSSVNICPRGAYCPAGTTRRDENPCSSGTYGPLLQQSDSSVACIQCPEGRYCKAGSSQDGIPCPRGSYCPSGTKDIGETDGPTPCPDGKYTAEEGARAETNCIDCIAGYYCISGETNPTPCPVGTFNPEPSKPSEANCQSCTAGQACTEVGLTSPDHSCDPGYYCPVGSSLPNDNPCPAGYFTDFHNLTSADQCDLCPERFACENGTGGTNKKPIVCAPGYYCPNGTQYVDQYPCPAGSWSNKTNLAWLTECWECPKGYYCVSGSSSPEGPCPAGYYCPPGTKFAKEYPCSAGSFSNKTGNVRWEDCGDCIQGSYCPEGSVDPIPCPPGTYNNIVNSQTDAACLNCTEGYYCPNNGTEDVVPCGKGYYSDSGAPECTICEAGYYCDSNTTTQAVMLSEKFCPAGMHCDPGRTEAPNLFNDSCPAGFYCLSGNLAAYPQPCEIGTYSNRFGLISEDECTSCTEGYYCDVTNLTAPAGPCPGGYYCLTGTGASTTYPCPAGTYINGSAAISSSSCTPCLSGNYCPNNGTAVPIECPPGSFCPPGSTFAEGCPAGTFGNTTGLKTSTECSPCPGGFYCAGKGNTGSTDICDAGYYCGGGASTSTPSDGGITGDLCIAGGYCPAGSSYTRPCPEGSYSPFEGAQSEDNCTACPPGKFCSGQGTVGITGNCDAGYYCTGGASTSIQHQAEPGHYAPEGATDQTECDCGTYAPSAGFSECKECVIGSYCNDTGLFEAVLCPPGYYCPTGSIVPKPCKAGTYNRVSGSSEESACNLCESGKYCSESGLPEPNGLCAAGYYCNNGSTTAYPDVTSSSGGPCPKGHYCLSGEQPLMCPAGFYNNVTKAESKKNCTSCPPGRTCYITGLEEPNGYCHEGYYCTGEADTANGIPIDGTDLWGVLCPFGHYCPTGSGYPLPCEPGTFTKEEAQASCDICPAGYQCTGVANLTECPQGSYCPQGTGYNLTACPPGTFKNTTFGSDINACSYCLAGYYCDGFGTVVPTNKCEQGYYCKSGVNTSEPGTSPNTGEGGLCPPGHYCPTGTGEPNGCPSGTYSNQTGLNAAGQCTKCDGGKYCNGTGLTSADSDCNPGFYCTEGAMTPEPTDGTTGNVCDRGKVCPGGTTVPLDCEPGGYSNTTGLSVCNSCPTRYYCPSGTVDFALNPCVAGYYCPAGTKTADEYPCPPGTYGTEPMLGSSDECRPCDPGKYCSGSGSTSFSGNCSAGYYCLTNASTPTPSGYANYSDGACLCPADSGGKCPIGYYCPLGTGDPIPCDGGHYCPTEGLSSAGPECDAGYYCNSSASIPNPENDISGGFCPEGYWCGLGTKNPEPCPNGTFNNQTKGEALTDCRSCTAGYYCQGPANIEPTAPCEKGYYCLNGSSSPTQSLCAPGYYCPGKTPNQVLCPSGQYQDESGKAECKICPSGYYCSISDGPIAVYTLYDCPIGSYCPNGTEFATQYRCPPGTYGNFTNLESPEECTSCPAGKYCPSEGTTISTLVDCEAGSWCKNGASVANPNDGVTGEPCPKGSYCNSGTVSPDKCKVGKFNNQTGQKFSSNCENCTEGYYCDEVGLAEPKGTCTDGYYCPPGSDSPTEEDCRPGFYCQNGLEYPCQAGTFMTQPKATECDPCPAGQYCVDGINPEACPIGFYCPIGTGYDWVSCPLGTYGTTVSAKNASECADCPAGSYCNELNATASSGPCNERFYCASGSDNPEPSGSKPPNGPCSAGYYCPKNTTTERPCPEGTYSDLTGLASANECKSCPPKMYCQGGGLTEASGNCSAGYYCVGGAKNSAITPDGPTGGPCPAGFYCPIGTADPLTCPAGTYNNLTGQTNCADCLAGYYCPQNSSDVSGKECLAGYYCPTGTKHQYEYPCPAGTYNPDTNKQNLRDCKPCDPGHHCNISGLLAPSGECSEGWYCTSCAWSPTPEDPSTVTSINDTSCLCPVVNSLNATGGKCPAGYFCPAASDRPLPCNPGEFCATDGLGSVTSGNCSAGYFCINASVTDQPTDGITGDICPAGHYCVQGTYQPEPCPAGTFSNSTHNVDVTACMPCTQGFYCLSGTSEPTGPCAEGFYCPGGQNNSRPAEFECPDGFYCSGQNSEPYACANGTYQNATGQSSCNPCPEGYYCEAISGSTVVGISVPVECPQGYYCPAKTSFSDENGCPVGTYGSKPGLTDVSQCIECSAGKYCDVIGLSAPPHDCFAGSYCISGAFVGNPRDGVTGDICPTGKYCEAGNPTPQACPSGSYGPSEGLESKQNCTLCPAGDFCATSSLSVTSGNCTEGFYCEEGSTSASATPCPAGYYCPERSPAPFPCPAGEFTNTPQQKECQKCTKGSFCNGTSIQDCPMGYYCPDGTGSTPEPCPRGTYGDASGLTHVEECKFCDPGKFCDKLNAVTYAGNCEAGYYCRNGSDSSTPTGGNTGDAGICPEGYYCPTGTGEPNACDAGTFNPSTMSTSADNCTFCELGQYCNDSGLATPNGDCDIGFYCSGGSTTPRPVSSSTGGPCTAGSYCPQGASLPIPCPGGSYAPNDRMGECLICTAGSYCELGASSLSICPVGQYCEENSTLPTPCSNGTYNNETGGRGPGACQYCWPGWYCPYEKMEYPAGKCAPGWYCTLGSWSYKPLQSGTLTLALECACPANGTIGGRCEKGTYCPQGASAPIECDPGSYCDSIELSDVSGPCQAGYYCTIGSEEKMPIGRPYGDKCPVGFYCPENSSSPIACEAGFFSGSEGNTNKSDCEICTGGWSCPSSGLAAPSDECVAGYYCKPGSTEKQPPDAKCPNGTECPAQSADFTPCYSGSYQPEDGKSSCLTCPPGKYCDYDEALAEGYHGVVNPKICPAGFYCLAGTNFSTQYPCLPGTYSDAEELTSDSCKLCDKGYYCDQTNLTHVVDKCYPGYYCEAGSSSPTEMACPQGSYCEEGSFSPSPCIAGTYGSAPLLKSLSECTQCDPGSYCENDGLSKPSGVCTEGFYCSGNSTQPDPVGEVFGDQCQPGYYCPINSSHPIPCDPGTYNPGFQQISAAACLDCTQGKYCNSSGLSAETGQCTAGYYCDGRADNDKQHICPPGYYCEIGSPSPKPCKNGTFANYSGASICEECPAGFYCINQNSAEPCPSGHYCQKGTGYDLQKCPAGTFNPTNGLSLESQCTPCTAGYYCQTDGESKEAGVCNPGFQCIAGVDTPEPDNSTNAGWGGPCPLGHQCQNGTAEGCPSGYFADDTGLSSCKICSAGFYCDGGTINPKECSSGYYCPSGTEYELQYPCLEGTYNPDKGQSSDASCQPCVGGQYCEGIANTMPDGNCSAGYFCASGSSSATPITFGNVTVGSPAFASNISCSGYYDCVCPSLAETQGDICEPGFYCPSGSEKPIPCDGGWYCPSYGLHAPAAQCTEGFYCVGSAVPDQNICPQGRYCPTGTGVPFSCPSGTFSPSFGNTALTDCQSCTPGYYCDDNGLSIESGPCVAGFYCPGGDITSNNSCPQYHSCPEGSINATVCPQGSTQDKVGESTCFSCSSGMECNPYDGNIAPEPCPMGYYCLVGTDPELCPVGTYNNVTGLKALSSCEQCPAGKYCSDVPSISPTGPCDAGYYCTGGASTAKPLNDKVDPSVTDTFTGNSICPVGHYCPVSSPNPLECPPGSFSQVTGGQAVSDCMLCPAGKYCDSSGKTNGSAPDCSPGFVCYGGSTTPTPTDGIKGEPCPAGFYCPAGTKFAVGCDPGTYTATTGQEKCDICPAGFICAFANTSVPVECDPGYYCEAGTLSLEPCPEGTYRSLAEAKDVSDCQLCDPHQYCDSPGSSATAGDCAAGYYCESGSSSRTPTESLNTTTGFYNGPCPAGKYCLSGDNPRDCPTGTLRNTTGAAAEDECNNCYAGYYCQGSGLTAPSDQCNEGYYCPGTSPNSNPAPPSSVCPVGHYCETGSVQPRPCPTGQYQPNTAQPNCILCPAGYYCQESITGNLTLCPAYSYCPSGTPVPITCPDGSYTLDSERGNEKESDCTPCDTGKYCTGGQIQGECFEGYFCLSRASSPTSNGTIDKTINVDQEPCPENTTCAGPCPAGFYCPAGILDPIPCPENTLRATPGASQETECEFCDPGLWCHLGDPVPDLCPLGYYCSALNTSCPGDAPSGPVPCPVFTYRNVEGGSNEIDCFPCPPGFLCNDTGLANYSSTACQAGYYCVGGGQPPELCPGGTERNDVGARDVADCQPCSGGYYCSDPVITGQPNVYGRPCSAGQQCPPGTVSPAPCAAGYYCAELTSVPPPCPAGYYCPEGSYTFTLCEYPFYCPLTSAQPLPCNVGYQPLNVTGLRDSLSKACSICPVGTYRNSSDDDKCQPCPAGYFCPLGTGNYQNNPCPAGNYCPEGGITPSGGVTGGPIPCPPGTYGQQQGAQFSICQACGVNMYNNLEGQTACFPCGSSASSSEGSVSCACIGENRAFQPVGGACVCKDGYIYYNEAGEQTSSGNSDMSCQPVVDTRCDTNQVRYATDRSCVSADYDCSETCGSVGGTINSDLGTCVCSSTTVPQEFDCYTGCIQVTSTYDLQTKALMTTITTISNGSSITMTVPNVFGPVGKFTGTAITNMAETTSVGVYGVLQTDTTTVQDYLTGALMAQTVASSGGGSSRRRRDLIDEIDDSMVTSYFGRRLLQTATNDTTTGTPTPALPLIPNALICMQMNEILMFSIELNNENRSLSNYPVYVINHLYNSNPDFDYGAFSQLEEYVTSSNLTITTFAHVFTAAGIYVFADSQNLQQQIIVNILAAGLECDDTTSRILPATVSAFSTLGIAKGTPTNLEPNWPLIIAFMSLCLILVIALFIAVLVWRPRDAGIFPMKLWNPKYRSLGEAYIPPYKMPAIYESDRKQGLMMIRDRGEAEGAEASVLKDDILLEDFNVKTLYDKMEDQNLHISSQLTKHQEDLRGFYEKINNQTEGLKTMLHSLDVSRLEAAERGRSSFPEGAGGDGPTVVNANIQMRGLDRDIRLAGGGSIREKELMFAVHALLEKLNKGKVPISEDMLEDARKRWKSGGKDIGPDAYEQIVKSRQVGSENDAFKAQGQADLIRSQHTERMDLEKKLLEDEKNALDNSIKARDREKQKAMKELSQKLTFKLQGDLSEKEVNEILEGHEKELEAALGAMANERQRQMKELRDQLAAKRRDRELQLSKVHNKQNKNAGIPEFEVEEHIDDFRITEEELEAALAAEREEAARENEKMNKELMEDERNQLSKTVDDVLDSLVESGLITDEVRSMILKQKNDREQALKDKMEKKRKLQLSTMKKRMAERKQRRLKELKEKQEQEREELGVTPELEARHAAEISSLEMELDAEVAQLGEEISRSAEAEHKVALEELHRDILGELSKKHSLDAIIQQELLDKYRNQAENYNHVMNVKRNQQSEQLEARLAAKRARKSAEALRKADDNGEKRLAEEEKERLEKLKEHQETERKRLEEDDGLVIPEVKPEENYEEQALVKEQHHLLVEMVEQQATENERLASDIERQTKGEEDELENKMKEEMDKLIREKKNKHETDLRARTDLTDEKMQQLLAAHAQELEDLERKVGVEQNRQRVALRDRLAARRQRKINAQKSRQDIEKQKEIIEQKKELAQVKAKTTREAERKAMIDGIQQNGAHQSEKIIQRVLEKRHAEELKNLEDEFALRKKMLVEQAVNTIRDEFNALRDAMLKRHGEELADLENQNLSPEELELKKKELLEKQKQELSDLEKSHAEKTKEAESSALSEWELEYAQAKLKLKEQHYQEFAEALRDLAPSASQQQTAEQAEETARRLEETKAKLDKEQQEMQEKLLKEREIWEKEQELLLVKEMADFEKELEEETKREKQQAEKAIASLNKRKEKLLKEKRHKMKEELNRAAAAGASEEERDKILQQHEKDVEKLSNKMDAEKMRMQSQLAERLKKRRNEKLETKKEQIQEKSEMNKKEVERKQQKELHKIQEQQAMAIQEATSALQEEISRASTPARSIRSVSSVSMQRVEETLTQKDFDPALQGFDPALIATSSSLPVEKSFAMSAPLSDEELNNLLMASPLYKTLQEIRDVISSNNGKKANSLPGGFSGPDIKSTDTALVPTPLSSLNPRDLVVYKFGTFILSLLRTHCSHPPVNLLVAEKIPVQADLKNNAFRGSFLFDEGNGILYVRLARLREDSVGRFVMLLVHTMSHIAACDLSDDTNPQFMSEFYKGLATLCDDLFFSRYKGGKAEEINAAGAKTILVPSEISQDLLDVQLPEYAKTVPGDDKPSFADQAIEDRLSKYAKMGVDSKVRLQLGSIDEKMKEAHEHGTRAEFDRNLKELLQVSGDNAVSSGIEAEEDSDRLTSEYVSLTQESNKIRDILNDPDLDNLRKEKLRNRLNNIDISISLLQKKIQLAE